MAIVLIKLKVVCDICSEEGTTNELPVRHMDDGEGIPDKQLLEVITGELKFLRIFGKYICPGCQGLVKAGMHCNIPACKGE